MSPPERHPPDDPREWLNQARSSLAMTPLDRVAKALFRGNLRHAGIGLLTIQI